ncbi:MAG: restriction endonuclease subunit S [Pseudomonadota bacterium]
MKRTLSTVSLGEVTTVFSGFAFKSSGFNTESKGLPLIRIRDIVRGYTDTFFEGNYDEDFIVENGDILIGMDGEFNRARWGGGTSLLNQRVCKVAGDEKKLDNDYLFHFLPITLKKIEDRTPFVTVKHLSVKDLKAVQIPLPPLGEQKRIAAILDKADALRRKRRQALALLDSLTQSIFLEMFGASDAAGWPSLNIGEVAKDIRTGPFGSQLLHSEFVEEGIAVLGIDNAVSNRFEWGKARFITEEKYRTLKRYTVKPGDVLITIMGTCGRCAVVPEGITTAVNTKHICCITLDQKRVLPQYLHACFLNNRSVLKQLGVQAKGAVMPGLNMGIIRSLIIPIPPLQLQERFRDAVAAVESQINVSGRAMSDDSSLFASLQHRAFTGQL